MKKFTKKIKSISPTPKLLKPKLSNQLIIKSSKLTKLPLGIFPEDRFGNKEVYNFLALKIDGFIACVYWKLPGRERIRIIQDLNFPMRITMKKFHINPPY